MAAPLCQRCRGKRGATNWLTTFDLSKHIEKDAALSYGVLSTVNEPSPEEAVGDDRGLRKISQTSISSNSTKC